MQESVIVWKKSILYASMTSALAKYDPSFIKGQTLGNSRMNVNFEFWNEILLCCYIIIIVFFCFMSPINTWTPKHESRTCFQITKRYFTLVSLHTIQCRSHLHWKINYLISSIWFYASEISRYIKAAMQIGKVLKGAMCVKCCEALAVETKINNPNPW